ncbi:uncharacterized protein LOC130051527 [Ostrea edulis]|uniref:uncharacterized protein LOC130051527 n=1 Tax=Ostrea edulis TaxID=37623 RepID=UPI0024AFA006|nr:uncharacterized protein LOC130051527 [Ostrea edulis]
MEEMKRKLIYETKSNCFPKDKREAFCNTLGSSSEEDIPLGKYATREGWKEGQRIIEFGTLVEALESCRQCRLGPLSLSASNIVGELQKGLGGYLYVKCLNPECGEVNTIPYGQTHREKAGKAGMPCFVINTKLGTGMIDSIGGPVRLNNFLATLNIKPVNCRSLKVMERRAGVHVEAVAQQSTRQAALK